MMNDRFNKQDSYKMFNRIAVRYDLLNRLLSMRQDVLWRKKLAKLLPQKEKLYLLDVATGTADQILHLLEVTESIDKAIGIDMSENMLAVGRKKVADRNLDTKVTLKVGNAIEIPFKNNEFDVITMSFGIRNVPDVRKTLSELYRVLKPGGTCLILEFSLPKQDWIKKPYLFYFRNVLPKVGAAISGDSKAYKYLNETVEDFPYGDAFANMLKTAGFNTVHQHPLTLGIATIYQAHKAQ
jgi:demethylmenaquinone methyltransferase/2-methoxy-6-polyprenyl-1,4-benzoquinol methylase